MRPVFSLSHTNTYICILSYFNFGRLGIIIVHCVKKTTAEYCDLHKDGMVLLYSTWHENAVEWSATNSITVIWSSSELFYHFLYPLKTRAFVNCFKYTKALVQWTHAQWPYLFTFWHVFQEMLLLQWVILWAYFQESFIFKLVSSAKLLLWACSGANTWRMSCLKSNINTLKIAQRND